MVVQVAHGCLEQGGQALVAFYTEGAMHLFKATFIAVRKWLRLVSERNICLLGRVHGWQAVEELSVCHDTLFPSCPSTETKLSEWFQFMVQKCYGCGSVRYPIFYKHGCDFQELRDCHHESQQRQPTYAYIMISRWMTSSFQTREQSLWMLGTRLISGSLCCIQSLHTIYCLLSLTLYGEEAHSTYIYLLMAMYMQHRWNGARAFATFLDRS